MNTTSKRNSIRLKTGDKFAEDLINAIPSNLYAAIFLGVNKSAISHFRSKYCKTEAGHYTMSKTNTETFTALYVEVCMKHKKQVSSDVISKIHATGVDQININFEEKANTISINGKIIEYSLGDKIEVKGDKIILTREL